MTAIIEKNKQLYISYRYQVPYFFLILLLIFLPFSLRLSTLALVASCVASVASGEFLKRWNYIKKNPSFIAFIVLYLSFLAGMLWTDNVKSGLFDLEKKLALLVCPLFIGTLSLSEQQKNNLLFIFILSNSVAFVASFSYSLTLFFNQTNKQLLFGEDVSNLISFHRVYFSMYLLFNIFSIVHLLEKRYFKSNYSRSFIKVWIVFLIIAIGLLASRIVLLITLLYLIYLCFNKIFTQKSIYYGFLGLAIIIGSITLIYFKVGKYKTFVMEIVNDLDKGNSEYNFTGPNQRVIKWKASLYSISKNLPFGVGTGDVIDALEIEYRKMKFHRGLKFHYNAHNQYLETTLAIGVIGLVALLLNIIFPLLYAIQNKFKVYVLFIILIALCFLTESMLDTQKGVTFFALFNSLFSFNYQSNNDE